MEFYSKFRFSTFTVKEHNGSLAGYIYDGGKVYQTVSVNSNETYNFSMNFNEIYEGYATSVTLGALDNQGNLINSVYSQTVHKESGTLKSGDISLPQNIPALMVEIDTRSNSEAYIGNISLTSNSSEEISFKDTNLESAIKTELGLSKDEVSPKENILNLKELRTKKVEITDLSGLEYALNLEVVTFDQEEITSLTPLENLSKLYSTGFPRCNNLPMAEVLKHQHITTLVLSGINYSQEDFNQLGTFSEMNNVWLAESGLMDISFTNSMKLNILIVDNNNLKSWNGIENSLDSLKHLSVNNNQLETVSLAGALNMKVLRMSGNTEIKSFIFLSEVLNLEYLGFDGCNIITDFSYINATQNLKEIHVGRTNLDDQNMQSIGKLPEFQTLGAAENHLSDTSFVTQFLKLSQLEVQKKHYSRY